MRSNRKLLLTAAFAALLGIGAFAGVSLTKEVAKPAEVEAAGSKTMYLDFNGISDIDSCCLYMKGVNQWPGDKLNTVSGYGTVTATYNNRSTTKQFYTFNIDTSATEIALTHSDGSTYWNNKWDITGAKSSAWNLVQYTGWGDPGSYNAHHMHKIEIVDDGSTTYEYNPAEWGDYHLPTHTGSSLPFIGWYKDGDESTTRFDDNGAYGMPTENINDFNFTAVYDDTSYTVTFKSESGDTLSTQNIYKGQSASYTAPAKPDEGGKHYTFDKWRDANGNDKTSALANVQSDLTVFASYTMSYKTGRYIVGNYGSCTWGVENATYLESANDQYEGQVALEFGDTFKIAYYDGTELSSYFGYSWILESCGAYHYFSGNGDSDIEVYARGTYNFYFTDGQYASGKKISIELASSLNAEHLAAQLMGFAENPGHCGDNDRFYAMKTIYLGIGSTEQTVFQGYASSTTDQFRNAYLRYTAWARALGENPWASGKQASGIIMLGIGGENSSTLIIVISITAVSLAAIGGYFLFRKKKEN